MRAWLLISVLAMAVASPARAQDRWPEWFVGPSVSTLGLGLEGGVRLNEFAGLRAGGNWFGIDFDDSYDDVDYEVDLELNSLGLVVDLHPFRGGFRISAGARLNLNEADLIGRLNEPVTIGGTTYAPAEVGTLRGDVEFERLAPYVGIGYGGRLWNDQVEVAFDLGAMYHGSPDVDLRGEEGTLAGTPAFEADVEEEERAIEDDLEDYRFYPVVGLSVTWRF